MIRPSLLFTTPITLPVLTWFVRVLEKRGREVASVSINGSDRPTIVPIGECKPTCIGDPESIASLWDQFSPGGLVLLLTCPQPVKPGIAWSTLLSAIHDISTASLSSFTVANTPDVPKG